MARLARASEKGARCNPARLLRGRNFRAFSLESARITFPRIVGRCAQFRRALPGYPTDDSPAFWRVLRARFVERGDGQTESRRARIGPGDFPGKQAKWRPRFCVVEIFA